MKLRLILNGLVLCAFLIGLMAPAQAGIIQYSDRNLFISDSLSLTTIDFNNLAPDDYYTDYGSGGLTVAGVTFQGSNDYLYVLDDGFHAPYYDWGTDAVLSWYLNGTVSVTLPANVTAVGSDLMSILNYASPFIINLSTGDSYNVATLNYPDLVFAGFMTDDGTAITSISYHATDGYGEMDNFVFRQANPVSEPTTMLLLGSGLIGLAVFRRKFRKS